MGTGFSPIRAFDVMCQITGRVASELRIPCPQLNLTIGSICLDEHFIIEAQYRWLNEALGVCCDTQGYMALEIERQGIERVFPRGYRPAGGSEQTREALTDQVLPLGLKVEAGDGIFTDGATTGLSIAITAAKRFALACGQEPYVLFPLPGYIPTRSQLIDNYEKSHVSCFTATDLNFDITPEDIAKAAKGRTPTLLVLTPLTNPMGTIMNPLLTKQSIEKFISLNPQGLIIADWAYLLMAKPKQVAELIQLFNSPSIMQRCLHVVSFSKYWADPGIRACMNYAPKDSLKADGFSLHDFCRAVLSVRQPSSPRATEIEALARAKTIPVEVYNQFAELIEHRRQTLYEVFIASGYFSQVIIPQSTLYVFGQLDTSQFPDAFALYQDTGSL